MQTPKLFGADYSVYVRAVRLALQEKRVVYDLVPIDVFADAGPPSSYLLRQPFGRIPAFELGDFRLYETGAITRYIDEVFDGPDLQPSEPRRRARVNQIISIADGYVYPTLVWGVYVEGCLKPALGESINKTLLSASLAKAQIILAALTDLLDEQEWPADALPNLADLHLAPMIDYFVSAPDGQALLDRHATLATWWSRMKIRPSMTETRPTTQGEA